MVTSNERRLYRKASEKPPRAKATWDFPLASVKVGTYRALSYITYPANSQSPVHGAPILLQRVS